MVPRSPLVLILLIASALAVMACASQSKAADRPAPGSAEQQEEAVTAAALPDPVDPTGDWEGALLINQLIRLRLVLHVTKSPEGTYAATLDSLDQGAMGLKVDRFDFNPGTKELDFGLSDIGGAWKGTLEGKQLIGTWSQSGQDFPLTLTFTTQASAPPPRPQEPQGTLPYQQVDVSFRNPAANITLAGTLTLPEGKGPFPAVVLISGSGPQDRDEALFGHKPFLVLADHLTRAGIAVLRADDRGVGASGGASVMDVPTSDLAGDVTAAVEYLRSRTEIDDARIALVGHSEGALIAPMVANANPGKVAAVVLLAPPGVNGEEILYEQGALIARAAGSTEEAITRSRGMSRRMYALLKGPMADAELRAGLKSILSEPSPDGGDAPAVSPEALNAQVDALMSKWFRFFLTYDPVPVLERLTVPTLAMFGEKDLQVPPSQSEEPVRAALRAAGVPHEVHVLPGLNHLFQPATTGGPQEY
ncbi:MAG TPA: alpha/beta fold hydrolase, partial [bacterium]|nr:alpha/beta fold hydrolase [bacterium]